MSSFRYRTLCTSDQEAIFDWHRKPIAFASCLPNKFANWEWQASIDQMHNSIIYQSDRGSLRYSITFVKLEEGGCELIEEIDYHFFLPFICGKWRKKRFEKILKRFFIYKHEVMRHDLMLMQKYPSKSPLRILIVGGFGLIGSALYRFLESANHRVFRTVRQKRPLSADEIYWANGEGNPSDFEGFDVVINLAGYGIGKKRWSSAVKDLIFSSRIKTTQKLVQLFSVLTHPPKVFICASATGFYGEHHEEEVDENSYIEEGSFLSRTCQSWEEMSHSVDVSGMRIVNARFGLVLSSQGGPLQKMLPVYRRGFGSIFGKGEQYMSWVSIDDAVGALYHAMMTPIAGPLNISTPYPIRNREFTAELARFVGKSMGPRLSKLFIIALFGQMGEELFLTSIRAKPKKLQDSGFIFRYPKLAQAFKHLI